MAPALPGQDSRSRPQPGRAGTATPSTGGVGRRGAQPERAESLTAPYSAITPSRVGWACPAPDLRTTDRVRDVQGPKLLT